MSLKTVITQHSIHFTRGESSFHHYRAATTSSPLFSINSLYQYQLYETTMLLQNLFASLTLLLLPVICSAWMTTTLQKKTTTTTTMSLSAPQSSELSRRHLFTSILPTTTAASLTLLVSTTSSLPASAAEETKTLPNGVTYVVNKVGSGPEPESGELVAIRFRAFCGDNKIDDIFETPEPYYTRVGSGGLIKVRKDYVYIYMYGTIERTTNKV
jgi:hypothetical protein